jgi:hypothetical protein
MSITLGGYTVETKKTVGELPAGSDNIIAETPCEDSINLATVQPVWKKDSRIYRNIAIISCWWACLKYLLHLYHLKMILLQTDTIMRLK